MDVRKLLKVYNYVNDEKRARLNVKFLALYAAFVVSGLALIGFFVVEGWNGNSAAPVAESKTDYVGLEPAEVAQAQINSGLVSERLAEWHAAHPDAVIEHQERVEAGGVLIGYRITYREP